MSTVNQENEIVNEPKSAPTDQVVKPVVDGEKADVDTEKTKPEARGPVLRLHRPRWCSPVSYPQEADLATAATSAYLIGLE